MERLSERGHGETDVHGWTLPGGATASRRDMIIPFAEGSANVRQQRP